MNFPHNIKQKIKKSKINIFVNMSKITYWLTEFMACVFDSGNMADKRTNVTDR